MEEEERRGEGWEINSGEELELLRYRGGKIYRQFRGILSLSFHRFYGHATRPGKVVRIT